MKCISNRTVAVCNNCIQQSKTLVENELDRLVGLFKYCQLNVLAQRHGYNDTKEIESSNDNSK